MQFDVRPRTDFSSAAESPAALFEHALASCNPKIVEAASLFCARVAGLSPDSRYPGTRPRALAVGGFVRDAFLGADPKDLDLEVYGVAPERLEALVRELFGTRVNAVGQAFGVLKVALGEGLELDLSIPRRESKVAPGHKGFLISGDPSLSIEEAARRRDFSVNALAADLLSGEIFDFFGGRADLAAKTLRVTDPERFQDDPLRVYRGVQFAARFEFTLDKRSALLMQSMVEAGVLNELPRERVTEELRKLLVKSARPSIGFELMRELGITERYFRELHALIGVPQDPKWHPEGDVWVHTMMVLDHAAKIFDGSPHKLAGTLAALMHDLGKPATTAEIEGRIRALGHEEAGEVPARAMFARLAFSTEIIESVIPCVTQHMAPPALIAEFDRTGLSERQRVNAARRLVKRVQPCDWEMFIGVCESDFRGREFPGRDHAPYVPGETLNALVHAENLTAAARQDLLRGEDLIAIGLRPGKHFGAILRRVEELRDEGVFETREQALAFVSERALGTGSSDLRI